MVGYGGLLIPLIIRLKSEFLKIKSQRYVDDSAAAGSLKILLYFLSGYVSIVRS